jgi:hypothetical protein
MANNYLIKVGSTYYFRCRIPGDLHHRFKTKLVKKTLKTSSYKFAKVAAKALAYQLERIFTLMRLGMLDERELQRLLDRHKELHSMGSLSTFYQ